ncbi:sucrose-6-phosphate hydrolase [Pantoea sp. Al-1710]|jgi:beta-fructofuranosidase|uniref:Sucrose-6-phosphate hydrolase n=1 Tax=Candidatus Pantoea communis TaxID=2608354 RepID=A0ABX0RYX4_9GAMM|nr:MULTISPECIES: sucrose-6-phosphate hydrolase [Enterobacterales]KGT91727.1 glycosyl hydrolase family 32 [Enterobacter cancerogenus]MDF7629869.1 sucrose-6-phosphate hydrolase [Erwiniaceae bacterium L1_55_4]NIG20830.1 sucrose-6-phosphate hydrolase [Pantoea communis]
MDSSALLPAILHAVMRGQPKAISDSYYPGFHLAPVTGLLNDPNGFIHFAGRYHLFYQWNALGCQHQHKCWGHWSSGDLVHWKHEPIALMPDQEYDRSGCYSGSAVDNSGVLTLIYTGNVKFDDGSRTAWQCLAVQNETGCFDKLGPVIPLPAGYTGHVRDPKVWQHAGQWYMVLGAQNNRKQGTVLLLRSADLLHWHNLGEIAGSGLNGLTDAGYMWECPDMFSLDDTTFLISCPQGIKREEHRFLNAHPCTWTGGTLDYAAASYTHGPLNELDSGFEFYAPQTTLSTDGRRLLIGWMGVPDGEEMRQPTIANGWVHQMTCVRQLGTREGRLLQRPIEELKVLRGEEHYFQGRAAEAPVISAQRLEIMIAAQGKITLDFSGTLQLKWHEEGLRLARRSLESGEWQYRYWRGAVSNLQILCDHSSVEIFINDGESVMSSRYFPAQAAQLTLSGDAEVEARYWPLRHTVIE